MSLPLQQLLERGGYTVRSRTLEWSECWLEQGEESWFGRGATPDMALDAAVRQAFPSRLARELLRKALQAEAYEPAAPPPGGTGSLPLVRPGAAPSLPTLADAREELRLLSERINDHREDLGLCPPQRQRAAILAWICEARAKVEAFPGNEEVREAVARVSRQLTEVGRLFWPGSVTALQLNMTPEELPVGQLGGSARTWARAAELAEEQLARHEQGEQGSLSDGYGWCDRAALGSLPEDPQALMMELVQAVEALGGPLAEVASVRGDVQPSPEQYLDWIRTLRGLRLWEDGAADWGRVAGRLRWWGARRGSTLSAPARELEAAYSPAVPWLEQVSSVGTASLPGDPWANSRLRGLVRGACRGRRVLFVSAARDSALQDTVEAALGGPQLSCQVLEAGRLEAAEREIREGAYELVIGAIGFQTVWVDRMLARACAAADVSYVRAYRGEPWAALRAVARSLYRPQGGREPIRRTA